MALQDAHRAQARFRLDLDGARLGPEMRKLPGPAANVGRKHPDYGLTVAEHVRAKADRARQAAQAEAA